MVDRDAYFICATPRTGSSLLCGLLASTGFAGRPESYFRSQDEAMWAEAWSVPVSSRAADYREFVNGALVAGKTANGVFAARVMWGTLGEVVERLRWTCSGASGVADLDVLERVFGRLRFVYLRREDRLAQAVSWARAEQTDVWYETIDEPNPPSRADPPTFDRARIDELLTAVDDHNRSWEAWFADAGVAPYVVHYEDLDRDPTGTARGVLAHLGLEPTADGAVRVRHRRLADHLNAEWIERYRSSTELRVRDARRLGSPG